VSNTISSTEFEQLEPRTQYVTRRILESIYLEPIAPGAKETLGDCLIAHFGAKAVGIVRDRKRDHPEAGTIDSSGFGQFSDGRCFQLNPTLASPQIRHETCPS
jgi:hypothetical protein